MQPIHCPMCKRMIRKNKIVEMGAGVLLIECDKKHRHKLTPKVPIYSGPLIVDPSAFAPKATEPAADEASGPHG